MIHQNLNVRTQVIRETRDKQDNLILKKCYIQKKKHLIETSAQKKYVQKTKKSFAYKTKNIKLSILFVTQYLTKKILASHCK